MDSKEALQRELENHLRVGNAALERGEHHRALEEFRKIVERDPGNAVGHNKIGVVLAGLGRLDEAEKSFEEAIRLAPDIPQPHTNLGNIYYCLLYTSDAADE